MVEEDWRFSHARVYLVLRGNGKPMQKLCIKLSKETETDAYVRWNSSEKCEDLVLGTAIEEQTMIGRPLDAASLPVSCQLPVISLR